MPVKNYLEKVVPQRYLVLDAFRGLAALGVAFGHVKTSGWLSTWELATTSYRLVDFFFVLSGFVIAHANANKIIFRQITVSRFLVKRFVRLWPLHVFVLLLLVVHQLVLYAANAKGLINSPVAFKDEFDSGYLLPNILMIQAWDILPLATWNKPAWSVSTEVFAYLIFAVSCVVFRKRVFLASTAVCVGLLGVIGSDERLMTATYEGALIRCMAGFTGGVFIYWCRNRLAKLQLPCPLVFEISILLMVWVGVTKLPPENGIFVLPIFCVTVLVFSFEAGPVSALLRSRLFVFLGDRSYSIYMVHAALAIGIFSISAVFGVLGTLESGKTGLLLPPIIADFFLLLYLVMVILVSDVTYRWIEMPSLKYGTRLLNRW